MKPLTLELRELPTQRIDMRAFTPDRLQGKSLPEIQALPMYLGRHRAEAGEIFAVGGNDLSRIRILSDSSRLDRIGDAMSSGEIVVDGRAGAYAGRKMRGGTLRLIGNAGVYAGANLAGGNITIEGSAGDCLGAALPGDRQGMRDGVIVVRGNSGDRTGDRLRRGIIVIEGDCGDYCGSRMIAGTIAVLGHAGRLTGFGMKRGTLLLTREPRSLPVTFNDNGHQHLPFLTLLIREMRAFSDAFFLLDQAGKRIQRYVGDRACGGIGEQLVLNDSP